MRCIGEVEISQAQKFCDYLLTLGIHANCQPLDAPGGAWANEQEIWVHEEDQLDRATAELDYFKQNPDDARFAGVGQRAQELRDLERQQNEKIRKLQRTTGVRGRGASGATFSQVFRRLPVTVSLILMCIAASLLTNLGDPSVKIKQDENGKEILPLSLQVYLAMSFVDLADYAETNDAFISIKKGQIWRAFSCFFIHLNFLHLAFNMMWMYNLGRALEQLHGSVFLLVLVIGCTVTGSVTQAGLPEALGGSPFGFGASGGVYGLFGFLWTRPYFQPSYPYRMHTDTVAWMLIWLFVCMTGFLGPIANGAHVGGLIAGIVAAKFAPHPAGRGT